IHFQITRSFSSVPDYGYYNWLFNPTFQPFLSALNLSTLPVTAKFSGCQFDCFFRFDLHRRSSDLLKASFLSVCTSALSRMLIRRSGRLGFKSG
ncbi:MAG: hypothetical protein Q8K69_08030, partial [Bacteroidota bacterium]|nr:hypothetical protein [Bacteroidota bacterium]